jgi:hypothetical protein
LCIGVGQCEVRKCGLHTVTKSSTAA